MKKDFVFVNQLGSGNMDGSSPENAATLAEGLGMTKYCGGTVVVCGPIEFENAYAFPSNYSRITLTSVFNGVDYRKQGAKLLLSADLSFYGDYTLEGLELTAKTDGLMLFFRFNSVTVSDINCFLSDGVTENIGIYCGCDAQSASYRDTNWESCKKDGETVINSGTWLFVRGGNRRVAVGDYPGTPHRSVFGNVKKDVNYVIRINGGTFTGKDGNYSAAIGMNGVEGSVFTEINGGSFASPFYLVCEGGENPDGFERILNGSITLQINGGSFEEKTVFASVEGENYEGASIKVSLSPSLFDEFEAVGMKKLLGVEKAPDIRDNAPVYKTPPYPEVPPTREPFTAEMEKGLGAEGTERMATIRKLRALDGGDAFPEWRKLVDEEGKYNLKAVESVKFVEMLSGEYSPNRTQTNYGVASVGGGYMVDCKDFVMFAFGDTKREDGVGLPWRANMLAHSTDFDYTDGILFDGFYSVDSGEYKGNGGEFLLSRHKKGVEMSKIPTGAVYVNGNVYFGFMSVRRWAEAGENGVWKCNYGGLAKSSDLGRTWEISSDLQWPEESGYAQLHPVLDGEWVYIFAVPGGRRSGCKVMRVKADDIENFAAYEYMIGRDENGKGIFKTGRDAMLSDFCGIEAMVGGVGVMYNEYLKEWVMMYCTAKAGRINRGSIVMRVAKTLDGEWSDALLVTSQLHYGIVYEPRICSRYVKDGGKHMMLICSKWEIYNSLIFDIELSRKDGK